MNSPAALWSAASSIVGVLGGLAGVYGVWRAVRVDRRTRALQQDWVAKHHDNRAWEIRSNLPRTAHAVYLKAESRFDIRVVSGTPKAIPAGDFLIVILWVPGSISANALRVEWEERVLGVRWKRRYARVVLPPAPKC